jgi:HK97 family phage major capsid protein
MDVATLSLEEARKALDDTLDEGVKLAGASGTLDEDGRKRLRELYDLKGPLESRIADLEGDDEKASALRKAIDEREEARKTAIANGRTPKYGEGEADSARIAALKTLGELYIESDSYKGWMQKFPQGGPSQAVTEWADALIVPDFAAKLGLQSATEKARKTLLSSGAASAGELVRNDWLGLLDANTLLRPLTIRDLVTVIPTTSDAIEYAQEKSRSAAAATVAEASALTGTTGTKPEEALDFEAKTANVRTIAAWIAATKRILQDATALGNYIDEFLRFDIALELEDQMLSGDGTGQNFMGLLNDTGVQTQAADSGIFYAIRKAITKVVLNGRTRPNAVVMHPNDVEQMDLQVVNSEVNHFAGAGPFAVAPRTVWGLRVVETDAIAENTALVGNFRFAVLFTREDTTVSTGTVNDDFIRNIVRVLAEMRAAFAILRPKAFCKATVT